MLGLVQRISSPLDLATVLQETVAIAAAVTRCHGALIYLLDEAGERLWIRAGVEGYEQWIDRFSLELGRGLTGWTAVNRTARRDPREPARRPALPRGAGAQRPALPVRADLSAGLALGPAGRGAHAAHPRAARVLRGRLHARRPRSPPWPPRRSRTRSCSPSASGSSTCCARWPRPARAAAARGAVRRRPTRRGASSPPRPRSCCCATPAGAGGWRCARAAGARARAARARSPTPALLDALLDGRGRAGADAAAPRRAARRARRRRLAARRAASPHRCVAGERASGLLLCLGTPGPVPRAGARRAAVIARQAALERHAAELARARWRRATRPGALLESLAAGGEPDVGADRPRAAPGLRPRRAARRRSRWRRRTTRRARGDPELALAAFGAELASRFPGSVYAAGELWADGPRAGARRRPRSASGWRGVRGRRAARAGAAGGRQLAPLPRARRLPRRVRRGARGAAHRPGAAGAGRASWRWTPWAPSATCGRWPRSRPATPTRSGWSACWRTTGPRHAALRDRRALPGARRQPQGGGGAPVRPPQHPAPAGRAHPARRGHRPRRRRRGTSTCSSRPASSASAAAAVAPLGRPVRRARNPSSGGFRRPRSAGEDGRVSRVGRAASLLLLLVGLICWHPGGRDGTSPSSPWPARRPAPATLGAPDAYRLAVAAGGAAQPSARPVPRHGTAAGRVLLVAAPDEPRAGTTLEVCACEVVGTAGRARCASSCGSTPRRPPTPSPPRS